MTVASVEIFDNNFVKLPDSKQIGQIPLLKCLSSSEGAQRWMEAPSFTRGSPTLRLGWIVVRQVLPQLYIYIAYNIAYIAICKTSLATIISNNHFYPALDMQYPALWSSELFVLPPLFDPPRGTQSNE